MRRNRAFRHGQFRRGQFGHVQWLAVVAAGLIGFLIGDWHAVAVRTIGLSASQSVALRFPEAKADAAVLDVPAPAASGPVNTIVFSDASSALLSPAPMVSPPVRQAASAPAPVPVPVRLASAESAVSLPTPMTAPAPRAAPAPQIKAEAKPAAAQPKPEVRHTASTDSAHNANRQGFVLNDAQIAAIKTRLHLSPDQEEMWPAVEAALRTIAYSKSRDGRRHNGADSAQVAALDPYGPEVQGLKSAAVPLIMSFNDEQRSEVRNLAHVMGLDQLATQF
jgi:hypothetical protein